MATGVDNRVANANFGLLTNFKISGGIVIRLGSIFI